MKESRTVTIEEILGEIEENKRKEIVTTFNSAMVKICAGGLEWQNFQVFLPGMELMRIILESNSPEYLMLVGDAVLCQEEATGPIKTVKFVIQRSKKSDFSFFRRDSDTLIANISINTKDFKKLVSEI